MRITVLMENTTEKPQIIAQHGLSLYIETEGKKILFDMGPSDAFIENAKALQVDLTQVDVAVLSHGHYDHGGGLEYFLQINDHAPVYISQYAFGEHYSGMRYIGLDKKLEKEKKRLFLVGEEYRINDRMTLYSCNEKARPYAGYTDGLEERVGEQSMPERFLHEQYLLIHEAGRRILISGCSHKGIRNIQAWFQPDVLVGGFHLMKADPAENKERLDETAAMLVASDTIYYTCHCTGTEQFAYLKEQVGEKLHYLSAGDVVTFH